MATPNKATDNVEDKAERDRLAAEALAATVGSKVEDKDEDSEVEDQENTDEEDTDSEDDADSEEETDEDSEEEDDDSELTELEKAQAEAELWKKRARATERKLKKTPKVEEKTVTKTADYSALEARLEAFERKETLSSLAEEHNLSKDALAILADVPADKLEATAKRLASFSTKKRGTTFQGKEPETVTLDKAALAAKALEAMARQ